MADDKSYIIDTNVLRYYSSRNHQLVQPFWEKVKGNSEYGLYICDETRRELEVQATNDFLASELGRINNELFPYLIGEVKYTGDIEQEHTLRLIAAHVKYKYHLLVPTGQGAHDSLRPMEYPEVSDARIILTAISHACGIVTSNVKEFAVLALFGYEVWDPVSDRKVEVPPHIVEEIENDSFVKNLLVRLPIVG